MRATLLILSALLLIPTTSLAEPFAPVPTLPKGYDDALYEGIVGKMKKEMPQASAMPAPRCPSCVALQLWAGMEGSMASVQLLSPESPEKVVAFYQAQLKGWHTAKEYGFQWVFWKGEASQKDARMPTVPHVVIHATTPAALDQKLFSQMKTQITVFHESKTATGTGLRPPPKDKPAEDEEE